MSAIPSVYTKGTSLVTQRLYPLTIWTTESKKHNFLMSRD